MLDFLFQVAGINTHETGALVPGSSRILTHALTYRESCDHVSTGEQLCDTYDHITIQGTDHLYKVQCCGTGVCAIHASISAASDSAERVLGTEQEGEKPKSKACPGL